MNRSLKKIQLGSKVDAAWGRKLIISVNKRVGFFLARYLISAAATASIVIPGAFWVADYTAEKTASGLNISIGILNSSIMQLRDTVGDVNTQLSAQLVDFRKQSNEINSSFATQIGVLTSEGAVSKTSIEHMASDLTDIKNDIRSMRTIVASRTSGTVITPLGGVALPDFATILKEFDAGSFSIDSGIPVNGALEYHIIANPKLKGWAWDQTELPESFQSLQKGPE